MAARQPPSFTLAIYANPMNQKEIIDFLKGQMESAGKGFDVEEIIPRRNDPYFFIRTKDSNQANSVQRLCGEEYQPGVPVIISIVNEASANSIATLMKKFLPNRVLNETVDLSSLQKSMREKLFVRGNGTFVVFLACVYCDQVGKRDKIKYISFGSNGLRDTFITASIKYMFPNLEKVSFAGNTMTIDAQKTIEYFQKQGLEYIDKVEKEEGFERASADVIQDEDSSTFKCKITIYEIPPKVLPENYSTFGDPTKNDRAYVHTMKDFEPMLIDPKEFPTNKFVINFLRDLWSALGEVQSSYSDDAIFSISVDEAPLDSPVNDLKKYSRSMQDNKANFAIGPAAIVLAQKEIFNQAFWAYPLRLENAQLDDNIFGVVIHGVYQTMKENVVGFDRSLIIMRYAGNNTFKVCNDHIHIFALKPQFE